MGRPPWRRSPLGQLHLIRDELGEVAEALCGLRIPVVHLGEPDDGDDLRCTACVAAYGAELTRRGGGR